MGEKQGNCIYVDLEGKWWVAEVKNIFGEEDIILIKEETEELREYFKKEFIDFINLIAPHILFIDENEQWHGTDAEGRIAIHQS